MKIENAYELITKYCKGYETFAEKYNTRLFHVIIGGVDIQLNGEVEINRAATIATEIEDSLVEKLMNIATRANTGDKIIQIENCRYTGCVVHEFIFKDGLHVILYPFLADFIQHGLLVREVETGNDLKCWME